MDYKRILFCVLHHPMDAETHNIPPGEQSTDALWGMNRNGLNSTRGGGLKPKIRLSLDAPRVCAPELARFKISIKWKQWTLNLEGSGARARSAAA